MLAYTPSSSPHAFLPTIPSPLSPRSANIYGPSSTRHHHAMNQPTDQKPNAAFTFDKSSLTSNSSAKNNVPFSQRPIKRAPAPKQDELKDRRRNAFLRKVQNNRENKRYEARGEDIQRLEFVRKQREEREELATNAPSPSAEEEEEEYELPGWGSQSMDVVPDEDAVDEFVRDEEAEMQALLEYMPEEDGAMETPGSEGEGSENLWSDDADYDALFSELLLSQENVPPSQIQTMQQGNDGGEEMDMS